MAMINGSMKTMLGALRMSIHSNVSSKNTRKMSREKVMRASLRVCDTGLIIRSNAFRDNPIRNNNQSKSLLNSFRR